MINFDPNFAELPAQALKCPACGSAYLHHEKVEIFNRSEDAPDGLHVVVDGLRQTCDRNLLGNPSSRRHGMTISFSCENCHANPVMMISQHKAVTEMTFESYNA